MVIFDPMGVAETTRVLMTGIANVCVLERRLGECEYKARDDAEMKNLPHEILFYTGQTARERLKPAHEITRRAIATSWIVSFWFCLRDVSLPLLLAPPGRDILTARTMTLMANGSRELIAALCLFSIGLALIPLGVIELAGLYRTRAS